MDHDAEQLRAFIGKPSTALPTPSLILSHEILQANCAAMLKMVEGRNLAFRPHVKTLKSANVVRLMLGKYKKVIASTLREVRGLLELVDEGRIDEIVYGIPFSPSALPYLAKYAEKTTIVLMVDHVQHVIALEKFLASNPSTRPFPVFIKLDVGTSRAGVVLTSPRLEELVKAVEDSPAASLHGFYCHAGHSYSCCSIEDTLPVLRHEIQSLVEAVKLVSLPDQDKSLVLSFGSTPTAHVLSSLEQEFEVPGNCMLELHGGNYCANDLQQVATGCVKESDMALRVLASVCSIYPERDEVLINAGCIALSREASRIKGFGSVVQLYDEHGKAKEGGNRWYVKRVSQEHGILAPQEDLLDSRRSAESFILGDKATLAIQHACITAAAHGWYFIVDKDDIVMDVWFPWKGW